MARSLRETASERARDLCEYCQVPQAFDVNPFQLDHVRAEKHGGVTSLSNLAWCCFLCNSYKGPNVAGYDPETQSLERLFNPRTDDWDEHYRWDGPILVGRTTIGRTTIDVLRINLYERVLHRQSLIDIGEFPVEFS